MNSAQGYGARIRRRLGFRLVLAGLVALAFAWLAVRTTPVPYRITSGSMAPTLPIGARVPVDTGARTPTVGDIIAFYAPQGALADTPVCGNPDEGFGQKRPCGRPTDRRSKAVYIKRVVAGPGDSIALVHGHVWINGRAVREPYARPCVGASAGADCEFPQPVTVPRGYVYLLGDSRFVSDDSRYWGPIPSAWIIGTVVRCSFIDTICHARR